MATLYVPMLFGCSALLLGLTLQSLARTAHAVSFYQDRSRKLALVQTEDRRQQHLPYVGVDRRQATATTRIDSEEQKRA